MTWYRLYAAVLTLALALLPACVPRELAKIEDAVPPTVRILEPAEGARVETATPTIEVEYTDERSGVSAVSFRALVNGRDYSAAFDHHSRGATGRISSARPLPLGENRLTVEVADRAGNLGRAEVTFFNASGGWLTVAAAPGAELRRNVELVLDASGSMREAVGPTSRMAVAKAAIKSLVEGLPAGIPLGLRVFRDCQNIASLMPIRPVDKAAFVAQVAKIEPAGGTPLVASLLQSFEALGKIREGERIAVLVTDGGESCGGSLAEAASRAKDASTRVIVIGFGIAEAGVNRQLQMLAESTGGAFFDARDPAQLRVALERSVLWLGYQVVNAAGQQVARGEVDGDRLELPLGTYEVRLDTTPRLAVHSVTIGTLTETRVQLRRTSAGLVAEVRSPAPPAGRPGASQR